MATKLLVCMLYAIHTVHDLDKPAIFTLTALTLLVAGERAYGRKKYEQQSYNVSTEVL